MHAQVGFSGELNLLIDGTIDCLLDGLPDIVEVQDDTYTLNLGKAIDALPQALCGCCCNHAGKTQSRNSAETIERSGLLATCKEVLATHEQQRERSRSVALGPFSRAPQLCEPLIGVGEDAGVLGVDTDTSKSGAGSLEMLPAPLRLTESNPTATGSRSSESQRCLRAEDTDPVMHRGPDGIRNDVLQDYVAGADPARGNLSQSLSKSTSCGTDVSTVPSGVGGNSDRDEGTPPRMGDTEVTPPLPGNGVPAEKCGSNTDVQRTDAVGRPSNMSATAHVAAGSTASTNSALLAEGQSNREQLKRPLEQPFHPQGQLLMALSSASILQAVQYFATLRRLKNEKVDFLVWHSVH